MPITDKWITLWLGNGPSHRDNMSIICNLNPRTIELVYQYLKFIYRHMSSEYRPVIIKTIHQEIHVTIYSK